MSAFLTQLAGMALGHGTPGAAHVMLPPRFAPPPSAQFGQAEWLSADDPAAAADQEPSPPQQPLQSGRRETGHVDDAHPVRLPESTRSHLPRASTEGSQQQPHALTSAGSDRARSSRREGMAMARKATETPVRQPPRDAAAAPAIVVLPATPRVASMRRRDPPPLSNAALATRVSRPEAPPVVHVTIDRIDVRAPDLSRPATPKPARRQPAISLADYLRNSSRGSRA
jgi:hypothetical protein